MEMIEVNCSDYEHAKFLYRLLESRPAVANISHKCMPTFGEHLEFVSSEPYLAWYLIADSFGDGQRYIGAAYLTERREIGIHVMPDFHGKGYGREAVKRLMEMHPGDFLANIAPGNLASQNFFTSMGFNLIQHTFKKE